MSGKLKILTIDGGGTRGIIPATILGLLENERKKTDANFSFREHFDLIAGTSTGGIIALALAKGVPAIKIAEMYLNKSRKIFDDTVLDDLRDGFGKNLGADYTQVNLFKMLVAKDLLGRATLKDIADWRGQNGKQVQVMITTFDLSPKDNLGRDVNFRPRVFNSFFHRDRNELLADLACRTSAGPTYFPIYQSRYIDGGVAINNPAMAAITFAINSSNAEIGDYGGLDNKQKGLGKNINDLQLFSLGTGTSTHNRIPQEIVGDGDWGNIKWIKYLPDLLTESNMQTTDYYVSQLMPEQNFLRIQHDLSTINNGKVIRLDMTDKKVLSEMYDLAVSYYSKNKDMLHDFVFRY